MSVASRSRRFGALASAVLVHALVFFGVETAETRRLFVPAERVPIEVRPMPPAPPPTTTEPPPPPPPTPPPPESPKPKPKPPVEAPPTTTPPPEPPQTPPSDPPPATTPPTTTPNPESLLRLPSTSNPSSLDRVLGAGGGLGPSRGALERSLDLQVDGPMSDSQSAARSAKRMLQDDLADDAVSAGLTDDYFRLLRGHVETGWQPAMAELNDGGASTSQVGMMRSFVEDTAAWGEMWQAYLDLSKQYANGVPPTLEPARKERLRELMRSRKGAFRVHAISEVKLTQGPDGKVLLLELPLPSGHPRIDDGVREALTRAVTAMVDPPSPRVHHGRSFSSWWRLRATWTMVPPTAFLTGAGFDITPKGITVDVPFDIKLTTNVMLLRTDVRPDGGGDEAADGADAAAGGTP